MVPPLLITKLFVPFTNYLLQHKHNAFLFMFNTFTSGRNSHNGDTFAVSYLINLCGLSLELARQLSKRVNLKTPDGPNAVIDTLKNYGFSKTQVAKLVEKNPKVLTLQVKKTLLPKLKFLHSIGVSNTLMPKITLANPFILRRSLGKCLVPRYEIIRRIVSDDWKVVKVLNKAPYCLTYCDLRNNLVPNIKFLRQSGVPQGSIPLMMSNFPSAAMGKHSKFLEVVKRVEKFGFDPKKTAFVTAIQVLIMMRKEVWESRFESYAMWGWNREMVRQAFLKFPSFMNMTEETATKKMTFLVKDMGLSSVDIAVYPHLISYSLEKRIIPRLSVIKILKSKGLIKSNFSFGSYMGITEEIFLKKFVIRFQEDLPLLLDVYKGMIQHEDVM
ncbi:unnamed protein product [Sphenostylis stenocarpa]|uniref:Uncharacterized protein n=1 Tax=Sphenostylis stenocarpa TaxID=92480 RepID=A0AA86STC6_9FABA|nr:unnamed protein product [Sphenostylis stenocarpa]